MGSKVVFITGTDTGVGKTLLTGLLLAWAQDARIKVLATKPFCSGGRGDVDLLDSIQAGGLEGGLLNPFYFDEPVAPLVSSRLHGNSVPLDTVVKMIMDAAHKCDLLLVEGSGGLLVPLGEGYFVLDLIMALKAEVIVVSRDKLGTLNHTLLTARVLDQSGVRQFSVVLMGARDRDVSQDTNASLLRELLTPRAVHALPFLAGNCADAEIVRNHATTHAGLLSKLLSF